MTITLTSCFILPDEVSLNCEVLEKYLQKVAEGIFMWVIFQHYQIALSSKNFLKPNPCDGMNLLHYLSQKRHSYNKIRGKMF